MNSQQVKRTLQEILLAPRDTVRFKYVDGRIEPINTNTSVKPVIITEDENFDLIGLSSGGRGGLLNLDGEVFKVKGCRIKPALETELYRDTHYVTNDPRGGLLVASAQREIEQTIHFNKIISREGFLSPYSPEAIIHYGKEFKPKYPTWLKVLEPEFIFKELFKQKEELAASVMNVKGDTRLPEIYGHEVCDQEAASTLAYKFGLIAGAQKKITEGVCFFWGLGVCHIANYVVFLENGYVHLAMIDFDSAYTPIIKSLAGFRERLRILQTLSYFRSPEYLRKQFSRGFKDGYKNPDKRESIAIDELCKAYSLKR